MRCGSTTRNIYRQKVKGARADRRELLKNARPPRPGDVVTVTGIDRRATFDLFAIKRIADAKAQFRSLAEPWADTSTSTGRLILAVLGGLADVERDLIRTRTAEGRSRATARGQHMGRPPKLTPQQQNEARRRRAEGHTQGTRRGLQCRAGDDFPAGGRQAAQCLIPLLFSLPPSLGRI